MLIAITGSNGFIGSALCNELKKREFPIRPLVRSVHDSNLEAFSVGNIDSKTNWSIPVSFKIS